MEYTTHLSCNPKQLDSLKACAMIADPRQERECHPLSCSFPRDLARNLDRQCFYRPQLGKKLPIIGELILFHSPLLKESLLVSFPPLNYMLKFRGYPYRAEIRLENSKRHNDKHSSLSLFTPQDCSSALTRRLQHRPNTHDAYLPDVGHRCTMHTCYPDASCYIHQVHGHLLQSSHCHQGGFG